MTGVPSIEIAESVETLKNSLKKQKTALNFAKMQALYLLKIQAVETVRYLAVIVGRSEATVHEWLYLYKTGGLEKLLEEHPKSGRPKKLEIETVAQVQQELSDPSGFNSYQEIKLWLWTCQDIEISYSTVHQLVRYELGGKLKTPRPRHERQTPGVREVFKEYLPTRLQGIKAEIRDKWGSNAKIAYWCQDETRIGLRTEIGTKITLPGVKPEQELQWQYQSYYCYGLVEPIKGRSFFYEFSHFNSQLFRIYLEEFAQQYPDEIHIIQLDNAPSHTAKTLKVPERIICLFQPPYCPELNPIERLWLSLKQQLKNLWFNNLDDLKNKVRQILNSLSEKKVHSLTGWEYIIDALSL